MLSRYIAAQFFANNTFVSSSGHCKAIKPDWDKLMHEFEGSSTKLIADVDCTAEGEPLCNDMGVQGFPTLKWGDPSDLQDYNGGRSFEDLKEFAEKFLV
jgi:thiol-disulfide isomerase/thioredoxin